MKPQGNEGGLPMAKKMGIALLGQAPVGRMEQRYRAVGAALLALAILFTATAAYADLPASPWTTKATNSEKARAKFEFGLKNMFLGWTEILTEPYEAKGSNVVAGIGEGLFNGIIDTVGGVLHFVTFPCPHIDVPLPEGGTDFGS